MGELPSIDPEKLNLPDTPRVRSLLYLFIDAHKKAEVFNDNGEVTAMLLNLAQRFQLNIRAVDLSLVKSVEDVELALAIPKSESGAYQSWKLEEEKPGWVINGIDSFILDHRDRFSRMKDLDVVAHPLLVAAQYGGIMVITHPEDYPTYCEGTYERVKPVISGSHWLREFLWRRFDGKVVQ